MKISKNFFLFLLLLLKFTFNQNGFITLPFKKELPNLSNISPNDIIPKEIINNNIMVELRIGTDPQIIKLKLEFENFIFYIASESSSNEIKFFQTQSKTYRKIDEKIITIDKSKLNKAIFSSDYIYFNKENDNKYDTMFLLGIDTQKDNGGGFIGLNLDEEKEVKKYGKYNFFNELKRIGIIDDYYFTINYNDNNSGNLIIGNLPHNYDNRYDQNNYKEIYADFAEDDLTWKIKFNEIYLNEKEKSNKTKVEQFAYCYFRIEKGIIEGSEKYRQQLLNTFMKEQIDKNLCFEANSEYYYSYYCKKEVDISKMKNIYFYNKQLDFTFELTYQDLFYYNDKDEYNYFLIIFSNDLEDSDENQYRYWILGEPFFKKYQFIFNKDSKTMGIYTSINNKDNGNTWWSKYKWYFILIVLLVILLCGLSVLLFLFLRKPKKRKIKANELDDEFDYTSDKNKLTSDIID